MRRKVNCRRHRFYDLRNCIKMVMVSTYLHINGLIVFIVMNRSGGKNDTFLAWSVTLSKARCSIVD